MRRIPRVFPWRECGSFADSMYLRRLPRIRRFTEATGIDEFRSLFLRTKVPKPLPKKPKYDFSQPHVSWRVAIDSFKVVTNDIYKNQSDKFVEIDRNSNAIIFLFLQALKKDARPIPKMLEDVNDVNMILEELIGPSAIFSYQSLSDSKHLNAVFYLSGKQRLLSSLQDPVFLKSLQDFFLNERFGSHESVAHIADVAFSTTNIPLCSEIRNTFRVWFVKRLKTARSQSKNVEEREIARKDLIDVYDRMRLCPLLGDMPVVKNNQKFIRILQQKSWHSLFQKEIEQCPIHLEKVIKCLNPIVADRVFTSSDLLSFFDAFSRYSRSKATLFDLFYQQPHLFESQNAQSQVKALLHTFRENECILLSQITSNIVSHVLRLPSKLVSDIEPFFSPMTSKEIVEDAKLFTVLNNRPIEYLRKFEKAARFVKTKDFESYPYTVRNKMLTKFCGFAKVSFHASKLIRRNVDAETYNEYLVAAWKFLDEANLREDLPDSVRKELREITRTARRPVDLSPSRRPIERQLDALQSGKLGLQDVMTYMSTDPNRAFMRLYTWYAEYTFILVSDAVQKHKEYRSRLIVPVPTLKNLLDHPQLSSMDPKVSNAIVTWSHTALTLLNGSFDDFKNVLDGIRPLKDYLRDVPSVSPVHESLNQSLETAYQTFAPDLEFEGERSIVINTMRDIIERPKIGKKTRAKENEMRLYGSLETKFCSKYSNVNIAVLGTSRMKLYFEKAKERLQEKHQHRFTIRHSRDVKVLRINWRKSAMVELSLYNEGYFARTKLLNAYSSIDPRIVKVVVLFKEFIRSRNLHDQDVQHMGMYGYTVIALHYLVRYHPLLVPLLHVDDNTTSDAYEAGKNWMDQAENFIPSSDATVSELFQGLLEYLIFTYKFDSTQCISLRQREPIILSRQEAIEKFPKSEVSLLVEDPIDPSKNLAKLVPDRLKRAVFYEIASLWVHLKEGGDYMDIYKEDALPKTPGIIFMGPKAEHRDPKAKILKERGVIKSLTWKARKRRLKRKRQLMEKRKVSRQELESQFESHGNNGKPILSL